MDKLRFGTAGIPTCTKGDTIQGIKDVNSLKLGSFELEFVRSINISEEKAPEIKKVYENIKTGFKKILDEVKEFDKNIWIRPEISGKIAQFGDLNELIKLSKDFDQVLPCIDFSHLFARTVGKNNTLEEFNSILEQVKKIGKDSIKNMHIHVSGIEYGDKGEKHHLILEESKFNYKDLMKALKEFKVKGYLTCESPNIEKDAILMKNYYEKI